MSTPQALAHLRVIDASEGIAGQYCGRLLSDYGADTVLVEPQEGTPTRRMAPFSTRDGQSLVFFHLNFGKHIEKRDPVTAEDLLDLTADADIVLLPAGVDHAALRAANSRLITCTISDFGEDGPRRHWKGGEMIVQALSGVMYRNGDPVRDPLFGCGRRAYHVAGVGAYSMVLSAVFARGRTGKGQHCAMDVAECASTMNYGLALQYYYNGTPDRREEPDKLPAAVVECKDGWVSCFLFDPRWEDICRELDATALLDDPRLQTGTDRISHWAEVVAFLETRTRKMPADTLVEKLQALKCVAGKAAKPSEMRNDPHLVARDYWEVVGTGPSRRTMLGPPFRMEKTPRDLQRKETALPRREAS